MAVPPRLQAGQPCQQDGQRNNSRLRKQGGRQYRSLPPAVAWPGHDQSLASELLPLCVPVFLTGDFLDVFLPFFFPDFFLAAFFAIFLLPVFFFAAFEAEGVLAAFLRSFFLAGVGIASLVLLRFLRD